MKSTHVGLLLAAVCIVGAVRAHGGASGRGPVRLSVGVDRAVLPAGGTERVVVKVGLDCARPSRIGGRAPLNLALVIDRSGSMSGEKIERAREAALEVVRRLGADDIVSVVAYASDVQTLIPAQRVGSGAGLEAAIRSIEAGGSTALHGGVTRGMEEVRRHLERSRHTHRVVLLSDGLANVGPRTPEELGRLGAEAVRSGISVTTIGLGLDYNEDLMTQLAQRSDGNTYFVRHSADLPGIFAQELGDALSVVARGVRVEVEFAEGVRPIGFVGREGEVQGHRACFGLNQLYGGQEKFALIEVEVAPGRVGTERTLAKARLTYEDALTERAEEAGARQAVRFSRDADEMLRSADHKVQVEYAANALAVAKEKAIALVDAGRKEEAAAVLRSEAARLQELGRKFSNSAVLDCSSAVLPEAARLERDGLSNEQRKTYRTDNYQYLNQQGTPLMRR